MDIEEFEKMMSPSAKRSRLEPFRAQIFALKAKGYADWQIQKWLGTNGLEISRQAVQQFIKKGDKGQLAAAPTGTSAAMEVKPVGTASPVSGEQTPADDLAALDRKAKS